MSDLILQSISKSIPSDFVRSLAGDVEWAYREAHAASYNNPLLDECDADYNYPHYRRSILEKKLRDSAIASGLTIDLCWNAAKNYQFTEITAQDWTFTLKHTSDERHMLKSSIFREQNAALNSMLPQLELFALVDEKKKKSPTQFSAIIFHGTDLEDRSTPGFIRIGVPREDFSWWEACYDIHEVMAHTTATKTPEEVKAVAKWKTRAARNSNQAK